ncbi:MAG TPA: stage V sporulation protein AC [Acholeplasmataceae bacterium]|nr:stage V sporulation protein AC [Acholeplasmataceae bacterium]
MNKVIVDKAKKKSEPKRPILKNCIRAFFVGGSICLFAQILMSIFKDGFSLEEDYANTLAVTIMVFLGALLTGLGIYDRIGQFAGAGSIVPITGFANSMTSAALESKSEGMVLGVFTNMFKLAGSVIVVGIISAFIFGTIRYLLVI